MPLFLHSAVYCSFQEAALSSFSVELLALNQHASAGEHYVWHAFDFDALKHRVINPHVMGFRTDSVLAIGIKNNQISIAAHSNGSFARIQAKDLCRRSGDKFNESIDAESSFANSA